MTKKEFGGKYKDYPEIIVSSFEMRDANESIPIYEGEFELEQENTKIKVTGVILFDWFPSSGARFSGTIKNSVSDEMKLIQKAVFKYTNDLSELSLNLTT